ncbi:rCG53204 [Rattus norvegicus]|uniref:RCG53204 n=1 Tax=Rattus norvegicus TaxID=10116 RepID=A6JMT2_RAT|nr:rCG53204 [Rattus norvegicus]
MKSIGKTLLLQIFIGNCSMFVLVIGAFPVH